MKALYLNWRISVLHALNFKRKKVNQDEMENRLANTQPVFILFHIDGSQLLSFNNAAATDASCGTEIQ
jgi:hypothetical protein